MKTDRYIGDVLIFPNGTIGRIVDRHIDFNIDEFIHKLRCIRPCQGKCSSQKRIGKPYTYQHWFKNSSLKKARKIGTEELLNILFEVNV